MAEVEILISAGSGLQIRPGKAARGRRVVAATVAALFPARQTKEGASLVTTHPLSGQGKAGFYLA